MSKEDDRRRSHEGDSAHHGKEAHAEGAAFPVAHAGRLTLFESVSFGAAGGQETARDGEKEGDPHQRKLRRQEHTVPHGDLGRDDGEQHGIDKERRAFDAAIFAHAAAQGGSFFGRTVRFGEAAERYGQRCRDEDQKGAGDEKGKSCDGEAGEPAREASAEEHQPQSRRKEHGEHAFLHFEGGSRAPLAARPSVGSRGRGLFRGLLGGAVSLQKFIRRYPVELGERGQHENVGIAASVLPRGEGAVGDAQPVCRLLLRPVFLAAQTGQKFADVAFRCHNVTSVFCLHDSTLRAALQGVPLSGEEKRSPVCGNRRARAANCRPRPDIRAAAGAKRPPPLPK